MMTYRERMREKMRKERLERKNEECAYDRGSLARYYRRFRTRRRVWAARVVLCRYDNLFYVVIRRV